MMSKHFDPTQVIPTPEMSRRLLAEAQVRISRLLVLVEMSERLYARPKRAAKSEKRGQVRRD